jgi:hypothetical protein
VPGSREKPPSNRVFHNVDEKKEEQVNFQEFREYAYLREGDVLLTVEHCDGCDRHAETTRHDPQKYAYFAQMVKSAVLTRYPMVKVLIKPISTLGAVELNTRLGAFEVQVCSQMQNRQKREVLHSKIETRRWPETDEILNKLAAFLPTCQLFVTVFEAGSEEKYLKGLKVLVSPKALPLNVSFIRPKSASQLGSSRPRSAITNKSFATTSRNTPRRSIKPSASRSKKPEPVVFEKITDRDGCCLFANIPLDVYEIQVCDSKEYKSETKVLNTFEEPQQSSSYNVYIGVKSKQTCNVKITLSERGKGNVTNAKVMFSNSSDERFYLAEVMRGVYTTQVDKGEYELQIVCNGYKELKKTIQANIADFNLNLDMYPKEPRQLQVITSDAITGEPLGAVHIQMRVSQSRFSYEGLTQQGSFTYRVEDQGYFSLHTDKARYIESERELYISHTDSMNIMCGLLPISDPAKSFFILNWTRCSDDLEIKVFNDKLKVDFHNPSSAGVSLRDFLKTRGIATVEVHSASSEWLRVVVKVLSSDLIEPKSGNSSPLLNSGVCMSVYTSNKLVANLLPPEGAGEYWDIGFIQPDSGEFVEVNSLVWDSPKASEGLNAFQSVIRFVETRSESLSALFGFESSGVLKNTEYGKDKFLSSDIFRKILSNITHSEDSLDNLLAGLKTSQGISFHKLKKRYDRYERVRSTSSSAAVHARTIEAYARMLGIDPVEDKEFMHIAEEGLVAPLPEDWVFFTDHHGNAMYRNSLTGEVSDTHPNDEIYRRKFQEAKARALGHLQSSEKMQMQSYEEDFISDNSKSKENFLSIRNQIDVKSPKSENAYDSDFLPDTPNIPRIPLVDEDVAEQMIALCNALVQKVEFRIQEAIDTRENISDDEKEFIIQQLSEAAEKTYELVIY